MTCGRKVGPFDCCSVVQGDCLELMKQLPDGCVDAVITDPPYGMKWDASTKVRGFFPGDKRVRASAKVKWEPIIGDDSEFDPAPLFRLGKRIILWGLQHFPNKLSRGTVLVWLKRYDDGFGSFLSDADCAWMNSGEGVYCRRDLTLQGESSNRLHPTQKPLGIMEWCIEKAGLPETILDPYCGSGTTLVAAKKRGRHFLGFEISEEYCAIARRRLAEIDAQPTLFEPKPEQMKLTDIDSSP